MNELTLYRFDKTDIRTLADDRGDPWFVAADVCAALKIKDVSDAVEKLDADEKGRASIPTPGGMQELLIVSESGMYAMTLRCRDAMKHGTDPHRFRKWVTADVLPQIRKTGQYAAPKTPGEALVEMAHNFLRHERQIMTLQHQQAETAAQVKALVDGEDYWTVVGYGNLIGEKIDMKRSQRLGKIASRICRENGWEKTDAKHPIFGVIGSYPRQAVALAFDQEQAA